MPQCVLCGAARDDACVPWDAADRPRDYAQEETIKTCEDFKIVDRGPRGPNGGLLRETTEVDPEGDMILLRKVREAPIQFVRMFIPHFV